VAVTPSGQDTVTLAMDELYLRRIKPVAVLIDGASFGGGVSVDHVEQTLREHHVPVATVRKGMDLRTVLEGGFFQNSGK
jgi:hypothetical protein